MAVEADVIEHLLHFWRLNRGQLIKIKENEGSRDLIGKGCRYHLLEKVQRTEVTKERKIKYGTEKTVRVKRKVAGWRFTPLGNAFFSLVIDHQNLLRSLADRPKTGDSPVPTEQSEETKLHKQVSDKVEELGVQALSVLIQRTANPSLQNVFKDLRQLMLELGKIRSTK
jgi:hypothetical protein